ncbi:expressed unknown protein [Seminavis robusta]|uniref:Uncharacterized protein n=1 Tax=Seminavis robusta TaxID=568900 RepID=A0A9N8ETR7_9STRA|nr:expressed unknown protein [Seminavis robusta]|eukprot:Sro1605_g285420.1 n/a (110) ;mRNA; r:7674-8003
MKILWLLGATAMLLADPVMAAGRNDGEHGVGGKALEGSWEGVKSLVHEASNWIHKNHDEDEEESFLETGTIEDGAFMEAMEDVHPKVSFRGSSGHQSRKLHEEKMYGDY